MDDLELMRAAGGTRLRLRVRPGAARDAILGVHDGALRIGVTAPPERGKANRAVAALLSRALGIPRTSLTIEAGEASRWKTVRVPIGPEEVRRALVRSLPTRRGPGRCTSS